MASTASKQRIEAREVCGAPSTARVEHRYRELLAQEPWIDSERAAFFTDYIKAHWTEPRCLRAGEALKHVLANLTARIWDDELIRRKCLTLFQRHPSLPRVRDVDAGWVQED